MGEDELGGLAAQLAPASGDLARLTDSAIELLPQTNLVSRCATDVRAPDRRRRDRGRVHDRRRELQGVLLHARRRSPARARTSTATACTCASRPAAARTPSRSAQAGVGTGQLFGNNVAVPLGNRPFFPAKKPPYKPKATCYKQKRPNLNGPAAAKSPPTGAAAAAARNALPLLRKKLRPFGTKKDGARWTAIRKHLRDFVAIIVLLVVSLIVGGVILSNQRLALPAGVPLLGKDVVEVEAELSSAQAVTPGQGQTVNIAGVEVGPDLERQARERQGDHRHEDRAQVRRGSTATRRSCCARRPA